MSKISVALPTYNGEEYLEEQIESVLNQTVTPDDIVVRDDNSSDGTMEILREYEEDYPDIFDIENNEENLGVKKNFEKCIQNCSGDFIATCDQDDVWDPEKIEKQKKELEKNSDVLLCFHNTIVSEEDLAPESDYWSRYEEDIETIESNKELVEILIWKNFIQGCAMMFRKSFSDRVIPNDSSLTYDHHLALQASLRGKFEKMDECLLKYRTHGSQDQGAPDEGSGISYILKRFRAGMKRNKSVFERDIKRYEESISIAKGLGEKEVYIDGKNLEEIIDSNRNRIRYSENRKKIYTEDSGFTTSMKALVANAKEGWYFRFGNGFRSLVIDFINILNWDRLEV